MNTSPYTLNVSVDCVLIGFDGTDLNVLLVERTELENSPKTPVKMKLPGRVIASDEHPDAAASDVLESMTGMKRSNLRQFKTFGDPDRTNKQEDLDWLSRLMSIEVGRIITIGYMSTLKISTNLRTFSSEYNARWCPIHALPSLVFDHNQILEDALAHMKQTIHFSPSILFKLLPPKFTALEFRKLYETITGKPQDVRNFHKKIVSMPYVQALNEKQKNVAHRAASYYKFDKKAYNKIYNQS